jgi:hypothetical protein
MDLFFFLWLCRLCQSESRYNRRSVRLGFEPVWGSWADIHFNLTVTVLSKSGAPSDERSGLSFVLVTWTASIQFSKFPAGPRQLLTLTRRRGVLQRLALYLTNSGAKVIRIKFGMSGFVTYRGRLSWRLLTRFLVVLQVGREDKPINYRVTDFEA